MIRLIEALNYRCLRYVRQEIGPFHVLVGPNASGKTSFLDVLSFLSRLISDGFDAAVSERSSNFYDLVWGRKGNRFELAIEADMPQEYLKRKGSLNLKPGFKDAVAIRWEIAVGSAGKNKQLSILEERIGLLSGKSQAGQTTLDRPPVSIFKSKEEVTPWFSGSRKREGAYWKLHNKARSNRSGPSFFDNMPSLWYFRTNNKDPDTADDMIAPFSNLRYAKCHLSLDSESLRKPSPPGKGILPLNDGSNLPWVISNLQEKAPKRFAFWLAHLQTGVPDLIGIRIVERDEDKHRYIMAQFKGGLEIPSWMLSDGTLRLMALTILAYIPDFHSICLIEEPENSIHPTNIETVMQSLSSVYEGQVLVATHSPIVLGVTKPKDILVFSRDDETGTHVVTGDKHPALKEWKGEIDLGTLFAGGVLG